MTEIRKMSLNIAGNSKESSLKDEEIIINLQQCIHFIN